MRYDTALPRPAGVAALILSRSARNLPVRREGGCGGGHGGQPDADTEGAAMCQGCRKINKVYSAGRTRETGRNRAPCGGRRSVRGGSAGGCGPRGENASVACFAISDRLWCFDAPSHTRSDPGRRTADRVWREQPVRE
ncbi:hypothetical protein GCM10009635_48830 [Actinocatenispora thailandica]